MNTLTLHTIDTLWLSVYIGISRVCEKDRRTLSRRDRVWRILKEVTLIRKLKQLCYPSNKGFPSTFLRSRYNYSFRTSETPYPTKVHKKIILSINSRTFRVYNIKTLFMYKMTHPPFKIHCRNPFSRLVPSTIRSRNWNHDFSKSFSPPGTYSYYKPSDTNHVLYNDFSYTYYNFNCHFSLLVVKKLIFFSVWWVLSLRLNTSKKDLS